MATFERQNSFGWLVVLDTFLAGAGGGVFLAGYILNLLGKYEAIARIGILLGPVLAIAGSFFLLAELGSPKRVYRVLSNPSSWIARGSLFMTVFIISGIMYSFPSLFDSQWTSSDPGRIFGIICAVFSILVSVYPGFLFGVVKAIPFWNTSILPVLFMFLSWYTGIAILMLSALLTASAIGVTSYHALGAVVIVLLVLSIVIIAGYLEVNRQGNATSRASVQLLKTPLFIYGAGLCGLLAPLALLIVSVIMGNIMIVGLLTGFSSALLILGGLLVRYGILNAGVYQPLR